MYVDEDGDGRRFVGHRRPSAALGRALAAAWHRGGRLVAVRPELGRPDPEPLHGRHEPYRQESYINALNGGVERVFDPLTEQFSGDPLLRELLVLLGRMFSAVDGTPVWNIKLHPYRITAGEQVGHPAPEGRHRDGVTFITSLLISRTNVEGGESGVYTDEDEHLLTVTLTEPGDLLLGDDARTTHSVTPVRPVDGSAPAHRDVLVIAYTAR
ncbi:2OG-Fe dioxygenase family protein [Streptomyces tateyamensis]|uniref:2OG-Fe dioxygenase family protein n=1 Tax=Streptomyces tateyamensis TaxID=565073 RepID=UPI001FEC6F30|nr:2OG-Fe dioxygenase family protein [Streptomyces tateyamensis]